MFNFFRIVLSDTKVNHKSKIISFCYNSKYKIFFYSNGDVQIFSEDWECTIFHIKDEVKFCCVPEECNILITLCQSLGTSQYVIKVFAISKYARKAPSLISKAEFENACKVTTFNAFNILGAELWIAIGLHNGNILLYRSCLLKEILPKAFKCLNVCSRPIKGIAFSQYGEEVNIFTCSDDGIFYYKFSNTIFNEIKVSLDDIALAVHCCTLQQTSKLKNEQYFVVARDDGLYCYMKEGRGPCYALNGKKKIVEWFQNKYIIVLNTIEGWKMQDNEIFQLVVIDIDNKIIVLNKELFNVASIQVVYDLSSCLIFFKDGSVMTLKEKGMRYKIKHLIRKNMYNMAIKLLEECNIDPDIVADVLISYGDHLLQRGDIFGAVQIYSKTIGIVSPFTVVNKLSDFRYNECLIEYLSLLNLTELKSSEHFKLLKNCRQRIELPDRAFKIFEEAGNECGKLLMSCSATKQNENIASILSALQDKRNTLSYLKMLSHEEIMDFLLEYGHFLISQYPEDFIETAKYLLTDHFSNNQYKILKIILPFLLLNKTFSTNFLSDLCNQNKTTFLYNIWTELTLQMWQNGNFDTEFVIAFLKINGTHISTDNTFIFCRNYEFWPGIRFMYNKCGVQILSVRCLTKCFKMYPLYINEFSNENNSRCNQMWIRSLRKNDLLSNYAFKLVNEIFKRIIKASPYYILNILGDVMSNSNFFISNFNDLFLDDIVFQYFKSNELIKKVRLLEQKVVNTKNTLQKYNNRPIEFRSRSCEVCKQMTKLPTLYFLCQHSFHKECIRQYSDSFMCIVCSNNRQLGLVIKPGIEDIQYNSNEINMQKKISKKLEYSIFNINNYFNISSLHKNKNSVSKHESSNPFIGCNMELEESKYMAKKYDNNLNPFNVKK